MTSHTGEGLSPFPPDPPTHSAWNRSHDLSHQRGPVTIPSDPPTHSAWNRIHEFSLWGGPVTIPPDPPTHSAWNRSHDLSHQGGPVTIPSDPPRSLTGTMGIDQHHAVMSAAPIRVYTRTVPTGIIHPVQVCIVSKVGTP